MTEKASDKLMFPVNLGNLPPADKMIHVQANGAQLDELAAACDVIEFESFEAKVRIKRWRKHGATVQGNLRAKLFQQCVATLELMECELESDFERHILRERDGDYTLPEVIDGEMVLDPEAEDAPDLIVGEVFDLWDILLEELNLVIDPFPRSESAAEVSDNAVTEQGKETGESPTHRPFAGLKALITEKKSNT